MSNLTEADLPGSGVIERASGRRVLVLLLTYDIGQLVPDRMPNVPKVALGASVLHYDSQGSRNTVEAGLRHAASPPQRRGEVIGEKGHSMTEKDRRAWANRGSHGGNAVYGLGLIGALVYYIQNADGFWAVILAILKSLVWPAFAVYYLLKFLSA